MANRTDAISDFFQTARAGVQSATPFDLLSELGRATTAYHEAPPDRVESARLEYEDVLLRFNSAQATKPELH